MTIEHYKPGDRIELQHDENSPWTKKGILVRPSIPTVEAPFKPQWVVKIDGQDGEYPAPGVCIRKLMED